MKKIAVLIGGIAYEIQRHLVEGIMNYAEGKDIGVFVFTCNGDGYRQSDYGIGEFNIYRLPDLTTYDGVIIAQDTIQNKQITNELIALIKESKRPAVSIESKIEGISCLHTDNKEAMREMVSHLVERHAVKSIAYLSGPKQNAESYERLQGVKEAAQRYGLTVEEDDVFYGNYWVDSGKEFIRRLLAGAGKLPDAIVCANDDMAIGAYLELRRAGIQVGEQIILTGFDCVTDSKHLSPRITTIEKPQSQMGFEACRMLLEDVENQDKKFKTRCHYRGSCGCNDTRMRNVADVQVNAIERRLNSVAFSENVKNMSSDLNCCENLDDFSSCLSRYICRTDFQYFYLCLCEEDYAMNTTEYVDQRSEEYSAKIHIPVAYENGTIHEYGFFNKNKLLPSRCMEKMKGNTCIVMPLHFQKKCLGYCVMSGSDLPIKSSQFQNWITNISNALENIQKQSTLIRLINKLNEMWIMDSMTKVFNRAGFYKFAGKIEEECQRENKRIGIIFVDINKLKEVNDSYGHEEGDSYILAVAESMKKIKLNGQIIMRYGGDEFVVLGKVGKGDDFSGYQETLNRELDRQREMHDKPYEMSVSAGFHVASVDMEFKLDVMIEKADKEMYRMKKENRKRKGSNNPC